MTVSKSIPRAESPQSVGVSAKAVGEFLFEAQKRHMEYHSLMVIRHGQVAVEWYNEPYDSKSPHTMYSISKSFTATAVGFAVSEGLLTLDTKVLDLFPDHPPKRADARFDKLTVRNLLMMSGGKQPSIFTEKGKIDWIDDFINSPWVFEPGEKFLYVNENIFMLSAMINRVTGMTLREYLTPRLFEPLGIEVPFWETDSNGIEAGGWGLYITTEDLAKFILCYAEGGKYNGEQIIPAEWVREATKKQINNSDNGPAIDDMCGYGYCFWMNHIDGTYRADGMFSQFGIVFPEHDAVVVVTSGIPNEQAARDCLWEFFPKAFEDVEDEGLQIGKYLIEEPCHGGRSYYEPTIEDRYIKFRKKILLNIAGYPMSVLPLAVTYMMTDRAGNIDMVKFRFGDKECTMEWSEGKEVNTVPLGMDGHYRYATMRLGKTDFKVCSNAAWLDDKTLLVSIRPIETVGKRNMIFNFRRNDKVTMTPSSTPSIEEISYTLDTIFKKLFKSKVVYGVMQKAVTLFPLIVEPRHYGKFVEGIKK
ncbi:MAG: serine hydrolase [Oscillospiraceae bacterium]|nr:serine hydrolase [Oscillospiraceae bacterium]